MHWLLWDVIGRLGLHLLGWLLRNLLDQLSLNWLTLYIRRISSERILIALVARRKLRLLKGRALHLI